jgi:hypothetical protein
MFICCVCQELPGDKGCLQSSCAEDCRANLCHDCYEGIKTRGDLRCPICRAALPRVFKKDPTLWRFTRQFPRTMKCGEKSSSPESHISGCGECTAIALGEEEEARFAKYKNKRKANSGARSPPGSPAYYRPTSPAYSPTSPVYLPRFHPSPPGSPGSSGSPGSPGYPGSPAYYRPTSPAYAPFPSREGDSISRQAHRPVSMARRVIAEFGQGSSSRGHQSLFSSFGQGSRLGQGSSSQRPRQPERVTYSDSSDSTDTESEEEEEANPPPRFQPRAKRARNDSRR